jgi:drug/metabolite transporter (DMT)-like permease
MSWILITLFCAITLAAHDAFCKKASDEIGTVLLGFIRWAAIIPFIAFIFPFIEIPKLSIDFYITGLCLIPLEIIAIFLYVTAIKTSPLSVTLPFVSFTSPFVIFTGYIFLGEKISFIGFCGILLITAGAYLINSHAIKEGILAPIRAIGRERGSLMMIAAAFIFSFTSVLGKRAILLSSPEFFGPFYILTISIVLVPFVIIFGPPVKESIIEIKNSFKFVVLIGFFGALSYLAHFKAISMVEAVYMISVKRTSFLFAIIIGWIFFGESHFTERFLGGALMLSGVFLIALF